MNNRILELMEQAMELVDPYALEGEFGPGRLNEKKFAELIVRECANIVTDAVNHREPASTYADKIRQHFGVEE